MTDQFRLADALDKIAEGYAAAAMVLRIGAESPENDSAAQAPSFEELPFSEETWPGDDPAAVAAVPHGSAAVCPKHGKPYAKGRYGPYCQSPSDDPEWRNDKGFCRITPRSAAAYLRQKAAA